MIQILCTFLMIAIIVVAVVKKYNPQTAFFAVSIVALLIWTFVTGKSCMPADQSSGFLLADVFLYIFSVIKTQISGTMLICGSIFGYVGFMNKIGASHAFSNMVAKPLKKIKQPYILLGALIIVESCLKLVIPSASSLVALLFAILYPIFVELGCSAISIASAFVLGTVITWGPADVGVVLAVTLSGDKVPVADFFISYQIIPCIVEMIVMAIVFVIISIIGDKKAKAKGISLKAKEATASVEEGRNVPAFYWILPLLPLVLILLFSGKVLPIKLDTVTVVIIALIIADIIHMLCNLKTFKASLNDINAALDELGKFMGRLGFLIVGGAVFAGAIGKIGGMSLLVTVLKNMGGGPVVLAALGVILGIVVVACTGSYTSNLNIFVPFLVSVANVTGIDPVAMAQLGNMACGLGSGLTPVAASTLFVTQECDVEFPHVLRRNIIPIFAAAVAGFITTFIMHVAL